MSEDQPKRTVRWHEVIIPALAGAAFAVNGVLTVMGNSDFQRPAHGIPTLVMAALFFGVAIHRLWRLRRERQPEF